MASTMKQLPPYDVQFQTVKLSSFNTFLLFKIAEIFLIVKDSKLLCVYALYIFALKS